VRQNGFGGLEGELEPNRSLPQCNLSMSMRVMAFYEKVIKVKADVAAYLININYFPSA